VKLRNPISLAAPSADPFLLTQAALGKPYPFAALMPHRDAENDVLVRWLLGRDPSWPQERRPQAEPLGGAALVTGFRGAGKTSLVRRALFEASVAALFGEIRQTSGTALWGPFSKDGLRKHLRANESRPVQLNKAISSPVLFIPVFIDVSSEIASEALMRRLLRQLYFTAVRYRLGDFVPDLMRRIRIAYVRTLGEVGYESTQRIQEALGISINKLGELKVSAEQEREFSETFKLTTREISVEEVEDEIVGIGDELASRHVASKAGLITSATEVLQVAWLAMGSLAAELRGHEGARPHLVFVLDELDKLAANEGREEVHLARVAGRIAAAGSDPFDVSASATAPRAQGSGLRTAAQVVARLKVLFSSRNVSAICIAGAATERDWMEEALDPDPMLRSMFSRRIYVRTAGATAVAAALAAKGDEAARLAFASKGRFKDLFRMVQDGTDDDLKLGWLKSRLDGWGDGQVPDDATTPTISSATTLERLAIALTVTLSDHRQTAFALDAARSLVVGAAMMVRGAPSDAALQTSLKAWLAELEQAPMFVEAHLLEVAQVLTGWAATPSATHGVPSKT